MNDLLRTLFTLALAAVGGMAVYRLKIPGGAMIGALLIVTVVNLLSELAFGRGVGYIPRELRVCMQLFSGMRIGCRITRREVLGLRKLFLPALILVISMVLLNLIFGTCMATLGGLDLATGLFACSPGGTNDMALLADEMGAITIYVVALQFSRQLFILTVVPPVFKRRIQKQEGKAAMAAAASLTFEEDGEETAKTDALSVKHKALRTGVTVAAGVAAGYAFMALGVKGGALFGSMLGVALLNIFTGFAFFPKQLNLPMRFVSGGYVGQQMTIGSLLMMTTLAVPVLIMWAGVFAFTFLVPLVVSRVSSLDFATCMIASVPGGAQEMALLAEDIGADVPKVTLLQTTRQMAVITIFPTMLSAITGWMS